MALVSDDMGVPIERLAFEERMRLVAQTEGFAPVEIAQEVDMQQMRSREIRQWKTYTVVLAVTNLITLAAGLLQVVWQ